MRKTFLTCAGLAAVLGTLVLASAPARAQEPDAEAEPAATAPVVRGTATAIRASLPPPSSTLDVVRRRGVLRVGVSVNVPWVMTSRSGSLMGFEVDVAKQLAEDLGVEIELVPGAALNLLDDLLADRFDVIVSGMAISPERALVANFSVPVSQAYARLLANRKRAAGKRTADAFNRPEVTIGVRAGAIGESIAKEAFPQATVQPFEDEDALIEAVLSGTVTAILAWSPAPEFLAARGSDKVFIPLADPVTQRSEGMVVRKGDFDFLTYLNTWIRYQQDVGWLAEKRKYWFNGFAWEDQL